MARLTPPAGDPVVADVAGLHHSYDEVPVLRGVDLQIRRGEFVALLGRSGSGKSTLLRCLAGLERGAAGTVAIRGAASTAFQEPRLLPWRRVQDNVALAVASGRLRAQHVARARRTLDEVGLAGRERSWPPQLSGGQAQRVSLARALVTEPDLLLLDEPFSALDALTRLEMHRLVLTLWRNHRPGILLVTHDVDEAIRLADRVLVLEHGELAASWTVHVPRDRRRGHPDTVALRLDVLEALGVDPATTQHPTKQGAA